MTQEPPTPRPHTTSRLLCAPRPELACFACCPPIRPVHYDPADFAGSLKRLMVDSTARFRAGNLPERHMLGFWCDGLGFLEPSGRRVGCLWHPAMNQGQDLRGPTGYQAKCAAYACPQAKVFEALEPGQRDRLLALCRGMDSFAFSSRRLNPLRRLLDLGPVTAGAAAELEPGLAQALAWPWLALEPHLGWLLGRLVAARGPECLAAEDPAPLVRRIAEQVRRRLAPFPIMNAGSPLSQSCDLWEARFWRTITSITCLDTSHLKKYRLIIEEEIGVA